MSNYFQKIIKYPKAIFFPSDLEKLHAHWPEPDKGGVSKLEGSDVEGDGREFQEGGDMCITMADSC